MEMNCQLHSRAKFVLREVVSDSLFLVDFWNHKTSLDVWPLGLRTFYCVGNRIHLRQSLASQLAETCYKYFIKSESKLNLREI